MFLNSFFLTLNVEYTKQWPLTPNSPKWRITRANVSNASHSLANVSSVECIESGESSWRMSVECSESGLSRVANLANF
jgi:hypothetical protein